MVVDGTSPETLGCHAGRHRWLASRVSSPTTSSEDCLPQPGGLCASPFCLMALHAHGRRRPRRALLIVVAVGVALTTCRGATTAMTSCRLRPSPLTRGSLL